MKFKTKRKYYIYRERGNRLINKSCSYFKMSCDCLKQCCRTNRIIKRDIKLKGERKRKGGKKRKEKDRRMRDKEIEERVGECRKREEGRKGKKVNIYK